MAFVVFETYKTDAKMYETLKETLIAALPVFQNSTEILDVCVYENKEKCEILASSTWSSKEASNKFFKSFMLEFFDSDMMKTIKECTISLDLKAYDTVEV